MSDTKPDDKRPFEFQARTAATGQTNVLEVDVRNKSGAAWGAFLLVELKIPTDLVAPAVQQAALEARRSVGPNNMATLAGIVAAAAGWSVWAINDPDDDIVVLRVFNGIDQLTGARAETNTPLAADAVLTLRIPLAPNAVNVQFDFKYGYQTDDENVPRVDGSLELKPTYPEKWEPPRVSLTCNQPNPTMIEPGEDVVISWKVEKGIAATLRGPLPGGNNHWALSSLKNAVYKMEEGSLTIKAVGPATYILDAEVPGPEKDKNVQIIRTLTLDIYSPEKYAYLSVYPKRVLPNGKVEIDWTVWGVQKAYLFLGDRDGLELELTEQNLSLTYNGTGTWLVHATESVSEETVSLKVVNDPEHESWKEEKIKSVRWQPLTRPVFKGKPVALTVADGVMALLTSEGLYTAPVGRDAKDNKEPVFAKSAAAGKAWYALAAFGRGFAVLRQTDGDDVVLERYDGKGQRDGLPLTLPGDFQAVARRAGAHLGLASLGNRVYVTAEAPTPGRFVRTAYSVRSAPDEVRPEGLLASLVNYRLVSFAGALYAYQRTSGRMLRFNLTPAGDLDLPRRAASAVNAEGVSMIRTGLLVPVGNVLAVLDPAALPAFDESSVLGLFNVVQLAFHTLKPERNPNEIPQDLSYNPQQDAWEACGHGLDMQAGAVAAYRGGASRRLWVLQPDGSLHTLPLPYEVLFAPDYVDNLHNDDLTPALDATYKLKLSNMTGFEFAPVDEVCRAAGLTAVSANGLAEVTPLPSALAQPSLTEFSIAYSSTYTEAVTLRFMVTPTGNARYVLELTLSGPGLGTITKVFKRLASDGRIDDVPDSSRIMSYGPGHIAAMGSPRLAEKARLLLLNATPGELSLSPPVAGQTVGESAAIEVGFNTPDFKITLPGNERLGQLWVTIDYAMPLGVELSPRSQPQQKRIRFATDEANMLELSSGHVTMINSIVFTFEKYDGSRSGRMPQKNDTDWLRVGVKKKLELNGVRLGDAAMSPDRKSIFVPLANPENVKQVRVVKYEVGSLASSEKTYETQGNVYSVPNAVTASKEHFDVMFAEPTRHTAGHKFDSPWQQIFDGYDEVVALTSSAGRTVFNVGKRLVNVGYEKMPKYFLSVAYLGNNREETPLDNIAYPVGAAPLAVTPDGSKAAVADQGGFLLIDMLAPVGSRKAQSVRLNPTYEPAHVVFSNDGGFLFCAHVRRLMSGGDARRTVAGRDITVTFYGLKQYRMQINGLPHVEGNFGLTANTRQSFGVNKTSKEEVALSLAVSPDDRWLFVSSGTTIMRFNLEKFSLDPWSASVELPCRLIGVAEGGPNAWTVYALGSYYKGDGTKVDEYKTHLYFVPAPR